MQKITENGLYENACDFIRIGFEDYFNKDKDPKRIKSAVRNIYCGIELLLKAYILKHTSSEFDDTFIHSSIVYTLNQEKIVCPLKERKITLTAKKSIEVIKRLTFISESERDKIDKLWETINRMNEKRNQLEHAHIDYPEKFLKHIVMESYNVVSELLEVFGKKMSDFLAGDLIDFLDKKQSAYKRYKRKHIKKFHVEDCNAAQYLECIYCDSMEVAPKNRKGRIATDDIECSSCKKSFNIDSLITQLISSKNFRETHQNVKFSGGFPSEIFSCLSKDQLDTLASGIERNNQISLIKDDPDIAEFLRKIPRNIL